MHFAVTESEWTPRQGDYATYLLDDFEKLWINHPEDDVDLVAFPFQPVIRELEKQGKTVFYRGVSKSIIPTAEQLLELTPIEDIIMVGYPNGIWDKKNNFPIIRRGITATHPAVDYNGKKEFLVDAACFPGSSGSPVFLFNPSGYQDRKGNLVMGTRIMFIGVLYAGPQYTATGELEIVDIPTAQVVRPIFRIPNNLGVVIKSEKVLEFNPILQKLLVEHNLSGNLER